MSSHQLVGDNAMLCYMDDTWPANQGIALSMACTLNGAELQMQDSGMVEPQRKKDDYGRLFHSIRQRAMYRNPGRTTSKYYE